MKTYNSMPRKLGDVIEKDVAAATPDSDLMMK
jgi:hypothetical protein